MYMNSFSRFRIKGISINIQVNQRPKREQYLVQNGKNEGSITWHDITNPSAK